MRPFTGAQGENREVTDRLDSFRKILELEQSRGFDNGSVIGGLEGYLKRWASYIIRALKAPQLEAELEETSYSRQNHTQRRRSVERWLQMLREGESVMDNGATAHPTSVEAPKVTGSVRKRDGNVSTATLTATKRPSSKPATRPPGAGLDSPVTVARGVDTKVAARLQRLGVESMRDLLNLFPRRHNDYSQTSKIADLVPGQEHTVLATIWEAQSTVRGARRIKSTEAVISDETGNMRVTFFGRPYMARQLRTNSRIVVSGRVEAFKGQLEFQSPEYEFLDEQEDLIHTGRLVPVYPLTEGLSSRVIRRITWRALEQWLPWVEETLPKEVLTRTNLMDLPEAIMQAHYPGDGVSLEAARRRLAFDELMVLQVAVLARRDQSQQRGTNIPIKTEAPAVANFVASLPFQLTDAQQRCRAEISKDMAQGTPMGRLLQGEVGSGKTVVALAALLAAVSNGYQGAMMAPTEILAEQHFATISQLLGGLARPAQQDGIFSVYLDPLPSPISVGLLVGSTRAALKRELQERLTNGTLDVIIGTHALIQEDVAIPRLALAVVDEQHRFGVLQRSALRERSQINPHLLVMSATPIPRTLALTLYGDLDISIIDQLPPGRQPVLTRWLAPERRLAAYGFVRKEIVSGRQAFVICPLIEESEAVEARAAAEEYDRLSREVFPDLRVGLLHGRLPSLGQGGGHAPLPRRRAGHPGIHPGGGGGHRCAQRLGHAGGGSRPVRPGTASPVPWKGRSWSPQELLHSVG